MDRNWRERNDFEFSKKNVRGMGLVEIQDLRGVIIGSPRRMKDGSFVLPILAPCANTVKRNRGSIRFKPNGQIIRNIR